MPGSYPNSTKSNYPPGSRFAAYLRDSGGQEQDASILQQEAEFRAWCRENGYIPTRIFKDAARTGSTVAGRDGFEEMIGHFRRGGSGEVGVVVWKFSRFAREIDDSAFFKADLRRRGFEIVSLQEDIPSGPEGRLLESIIDWMNQRTLMDMSGDIKRGLRHTVFNLKAWPGGRPPTGYSLAHEEIGVRRNGAPRLVGRLVPDETAEAVRRAFEMRASGATLPEIHKETGLTAAPASLGRLLRNKIYIGVLEYGGSQVKDFCTAVVDREIWIAAQRVNRERQERHGYNHPRSVRSRFILTGLLCCARCGKPMHGRVSRHKHYRPYDYYRCQSDAAGQSCGAALIPKAEIESLVLKVLKETIARPQVLADLHAEMVRQTESGQGKAQAKRDKLIAELEATLRRINNLVAAIEEHGHSGAMLRELGELEAKQRDLQEKLVEVESEQPTPIAGIDIEQLAGEVGKVLRGVDYQDQARLLRGFVRQIVAERVKGKLEGEITVVFPGAEAASKTLGL